ncbi:MAG TPA: hypothetical protein VGM66_09405 [Candidatus Udaeobacter sp.]|jgi:hypothetical protein
MLAVNLDNILFFLLIAVAALFQLLSKALSKGRKAPDETPESPTPKMPPPIRRLPAESDADRIRKFLEALGQPPSSTPPPPVAPRADIPPRRLAPVQPPPVTPGTWRVPREQRQKPDFIQRESRPSEQPSRLQKVVPPSVPVPATSGFEVHEALPVELREPPIVKTPIEAYAAAARPLLKKAEFKTDVATLLGSKSGLRQAIILREVFGPPRSLQELDFV